MNNEGKKTEQPVLVHVFENIIFTVSQVKQKQVLRSLFLSYQKKARLVLGQASLLLV